jgi:hypothetical protein
MSAHYNVFKLRYYNGLCVAALILSIFVFGAMLFWTLEHTDIVAFVSVLLVATILEAFLIFSLLKSTPISQNNVDDQRADNRLFAALFTTKMGKPPNLLRKQ